MPPLAEITPFVQLGGVGLMFVVWYWTLKNSNSTHKEVAEKNSETLQEISKRNKESVDKLTTEMVRAYKDSIELHKAQNDKLMQLIKEDQENESALIQTLTDLKNRLNQPIKCPIAEAQKFQNKQSNQ